MSNAKFQNLQDMCFTEVNSENDHFIYVINFRYYWLVKEFE